MDGGPLSDGETPPPTDGGPGALPDWCIPGTAAPCECPGGTSGFVYCVERNRWGSCECPTEPADAGAPDAAVACTGDPEWCDGRDNDCDGVVDNGEPCPDSTVAHTLPFDGAVWLEATDDDCEHLRRIWPTIAPESTTPTCDGQRIQLGPEGDLYYHVRTRGLYRWVESGPDVEISTPPCFERVYAYGFDGAGTVHYMCDDTLRRGNGDLVATGVGTLAAVLESGRTIVRLADSRDDFTLLDVDGTVLSSAPIDGWVGSMSAHGNVYVSGETAFVIFHRRYRSRARQEAVIFRVDGDTAEWRKVRRVPLAGSHRSLLATPDGRLFELRRTGDGSWAGVFEYPPDAPPRRVATTNGDYGIDEERWEGLLPGPRAR